jgi:hypothetical protein
MGFLTNTPLFITPLCPPGREIQVKHIQVSRTDTASSVKAILPADASIVYVVRQGSTASDAATTATVTLTAANNSGTVSSKADDVKGSGATTGFVTMSSLPNLTPTPLVGDITISAVYAETGTASTTGGPWNYLIAYVR